MDTIKLRSAAQMVAEMQEAGFDVTVFGHPKKSYQEASLSVWADGVSREGDKIHLRVEHAPQSLDDAVSAIYLKFRRFIGAAPEFDGRFLIEGKVGKAIDDSVPF